MSKKIIVVGVNYREVFIEGTKVNFIMNGKLFDSKISIDNLCLFFSNHRIMAYAVYES